MWPGKAPFPPHPPDGGLGEDYQGRGRGWVRAGHRERRDYATHNRGKSVCVVEASWTLCFQFINPFKSGVMVYVDEII